MRQRLFLIAGWISLGLAAIGAVLPLMPTTVFLILAAWCFGKASPELHRRLREDPRFGPTLRDWERHGVVTPRAKLAAVTMMAASWVVLLLVMEGPLVPALAGGCMLAVVAFLLSRPSRPPGSES
jgi:uncharacterized membrane protein YbaN (DUF454 family)